MLTKGGKPALTVGSTIPWAGVQEWIEREKVVFSKFLELERRSLSFHWKPDFCLSHLPSPQIQAFMIVIESYWKFYCNHYKLYLSFSASWLWMQYEQLPHSPTDISSLTQWTAPANCEPREILPSLNCLEQVFSHKVKKGTKHNHSMQAFKNSKHRP